MLKKISMINVKGLTAEQPLTGRDIITGNNGAGKTTRLQSMALAVLGYVPDAAKTNAATFELSSDPSFMSVGIETDDIAFNRGFSAKRKLKDDGTEEVSYKQDISIVPSMGETKNTQKEARIQSAVGDFPVMLDFNSFIAMTDMQQRDFIYSLSGNSEAWDRDFIVNKLKESLNLGQLEQNNPEMYEVMVDNVEDTISCYMPSLDMHTGILAMKERAKNQLSYWKKEKQKSDGASKKLAEMKNKSASTDRDLAENELKLSALSTTRDNEVENLAKWKAHNDIWMQNEAKIDRLRDELEKMREEFDSDNIDDAIEELEAQIRPTDVAELTALIDSLDKEIEKLTENLGHPSYDGVERKLIETRAEAEAINNLIGKIKGCSGRCYIDESIPCSQNFDGIIEEYERKLEELDENAHSLSFQVNAKNSLEDEIKELERLKTINTTGFNEQMASNIRIQEDISKLRAKKENNGTAELEKEIQTLEDWLDFEENGPVDIAAYEMEINRIDKQMDEVRAEIDKQKEIRLMVKSIKANIIDSKEADYQVLTWKQIDKALGQKGLQGEIIKQMLDPLKEAIDEKIRGLNLDGKEFFFQTENSNGKECFTFGWLRSDGQQIPFISLSAGEQLLLLTALMTVIIERNDPPLKILAIDDLNHLDSTNIQKVISGLATIGTSMDNIILCGVIPTDNMNTDGWMVHSL